MEDSDSLPVASWLAALHLDQYVETFQEHQLWSLWDCRVLTDEALTHLGVLLPGHRRRILLGLQKAFSEATTETPKPSPRPPPPPRRPVPLKRHVFRGSTSPREPSELPPGALEMDQDLPTTPVPPPVPPRLGWRPPVRFSSSPNTSGTTPGALEVPPGALEVPPGPFEMPPRSLEMPPGPFEMPPPGPLEVPPPEALEVPPSRTLEVPPGPLEVPPGPFEMPPRSLEMPPGPFEMPPGALEVPPRPLEMPPGALEVPPRPLEMPPGALEMPPGPLEMPPGALQMPPGPLEMPPEPLEVPPGPLEVPPRVEKPESRTRPPLPAKRHQVVAKVPPVPPRAPTRGSSRATEEVLVPARGSPASPDALRKPPEKVKPEFDDSDYEDSAQQEDVAGEEMLDECPRASRLNSLVSDNETSDDQSDPTLHHSLCSSPSGGSSGVLGMEGAPPVPPLSPTLRAGWLDKTPPQGSYIYQKRWVKLDADYLRYFDSEKDAYSKRFIPVASISRVSIVGDQKFEVVTHNRNFVFRAESDAERNEWTRALQQIVEEKKVKAPERTSTSSTGATEAEAKSGFLELRGFKHKLFVVVAGDKVFLYKNAEEHGLGIGITSIQMNVGNVKEVERRGFDLTTPHRIFSFSADSEQEKDEWVAALQDSIADALSNSEVAEKIWEVEANRSCADCGAPRPDWASINLCVVICKRCAGEHRGLGPGITKVRSLKMDRKVWTEELIELFRQVGNAVANGFWAANVPPSEAIGPTSCSRDRRRFLHAKYREGKYRRYHPLFGHQDELDRALCAAVTTGDLAETQALLFCGANVACATGDPRSPTPLALAQRSGQRLQVEFLLHNRTSEPPRLEAVGSEEKPPEMPPPPVTHHGFIYKTPSMAKPLGERKGTEEFSRRWCELRDGLLSYFESDRSSAPNGEIRVPDIVCLARNPPRTHGIESTFEVYVESERLYLFGSESPDAARDWLKAIAKSFIHPGAEELLALDFERLGRLRYKGGLNLERATQGWFALVGPTLHVCSEGGERQEPLQLRKLQELSIQGDNEVLVLVERRRTFYIQGERKLDFLGWVQALQKAAGSSGDALWEQQLTEADVPLLVDRCIDHITQCGLTSEGIYRKSGQNSKTTSLLETLRRDARGVRLKEGDHHVDDVANTLKRFFRELGDGVFTRRWGHDWLRASALEDEEEKISEYRRLLGSLPTVNRATLKTLINHLFRVQLFSGENQMTTHNLAIVFGPTLFQTDGKDHKAGRVVEDLISHYVEIFNVNDQEMKKQQDEIMAILKMREAASSGTQQAGDFICTIYLEEKKTEAEQHVKIPATMTAEELAFQILDRRNVAMKEKDYWSCFEVNEREEAERPLHYSEKVLPIVHGLGTESYLVVKKQLGMESMLVYLASRVGDCKHGMMKFREERNLLGLGLSTGFHDRYFILNHSCLRLYKEVRSHKPEKEWPVRNLKVYLGVKKKLRPPTCWGFTVFYETEKHEKQQWYLCCDTQADLREWFATFLHAQHGGSLWPSESSKGRASRSQQDSRLGNVSLIPLRGTESEMRSSVAALATDPLTLLRNV
ncbi:arf-GAP with Rho-GAP domain, ANK repeat and PH domain-containing protein 1 isoform X2 [Phaenicophaeus curvirostris]|uniref:arf-GAP with Rho-GAP domain, ANK repeat and PH domain-containing protein 1 isoform X2 n=1 Tax=Phaenicophaeus curvirostris TaxID=33595 RepID=UPI0037F0AE5A